MSGNQRKGWEVGGWGLVWVITGSISAVICVIASCVSFAQGRKDRGVGLLLLTPVAFVVGIAAAFLAVLAGVVWLLAAAFSY
jgi:hypothetical protein